VQYTIYYVFCRLVLEVLPNADESDNPISGAAADELEKACFLYFEENKYEASPHCRSMHILSLSL
jgi:hypothetical protein